MLNKLIMLPNVKGIANRLGFNTMEGTFIVEMTDNTVPTEKHIRNAMNRWL